MRTRYSLVNVSSVAGSRRRFSEASTALALRYRWVCNGSRMTAADSNPVTEWSTVPDVFRSVVRRYGPRPALDANGVAMTYTELDRLSNRVAHGLIERGGEEPLALVAPLDLSSVIVMLGALKARRVLVPLDPREPPARVRLVVEEFGAAMISAASFEQLASTSDRDPFLSHDPDAATFVYFTSGSTGRPKGIAKGHGRLISAALGFAFAPEDRFAIITPLAFAGSITPVFGTLLSGATGCLFDPVADGIDLLAEWIDEVRITVVQTSPSVLQAIAQELEAQGRRVGSVRLAILVGEPCHWDRLEDVRRVLPAATITDVYGTSEAGYVAANSLSPGERLPNGRLPFRSLFPGQSVEIVDDLGHSLPVETAGEIMVRGSDVALGYWGQPDDPVQRFGYERHGVRSIRTGDRGRLLKDGTLEHLGRADLRVKVNGQMVDLEEVERALEVLDGVQGAVISPVPETGGDTRLVAYVVGDGRATPSPPDLRRALAQSLPPFMIPSAFVAVDVFPRTDRGKVDREALRQGALDAPPRAEYAPPSDRREREIAEIVSEVLNLERVGAHDDLFELGADSLSVSALLSRIAERLGAELTPGDLLGNPTVERLALRVSESQDSDERVLVRLNLVRSGTPFFCVTGAGGLGFNLRFLGRRLDRPMYSFVPRGMERRARPDRTVEAAAERYVRELRKIQPSGPYLVGGHSFGGLVAYEMACRLRRAGEKVGLLVLLDPASREPTFRGRARRIVSVSDGSRTGGVDALRRLTRHARLWVEHGAQVALAGIVQRSPRRQFSVFFLLSMRMGRSYVPEPYDGPALLLRTSGWGQFDDLDMTRLLTGETVVRDVSGNHFSMVQEPHVAGLAGVLRDALAGADPAGALDPKRPCRSR